MPSIAKSAQWWSIALVACVTAGLCLLHLPYPFFMDQALFMSAARELADGARMYGDFWDLKQPGIFWWNELAGYLFGFDALGLRLMDVCWSLVVAAMLWLLLRSRGLLAATLGPILSFGSFYAVATPWHLSQVEWLVGGPLVILIGCLCAEPATTTTDADQATSAARLARHEPRPIEAKGLADGARNSWDGTPARYFLAGVMLAAVFLLKLILIPVAGVMMLIALGHDRWNRQVPWSALLWRQITPAVLGFASVFVPVLIYMQMVGTLSLAIWTTFVDPGEVLREYSHHSVRLLMSSLRWFLVSDWPLLPWALWALYVGLRQRSRLTWMLTAWITIGFAAIAVQVLSFWPYHFDLFFIPVGLLASLGFADVLARFKVNRQWMWHRAAAAAMVLCTVIAFVLPLARKAQYIAAVHPFPIDTRHGLELTSTDGSTRGLIEAADAVRGLTGETDRIVSWGDARMYFLVGRRPVVQVDGGTNYVTSQLQVAAKIILDQRPPLVFISKYRDPEVTNHGNALIPRVVAENYTRYYENAAGAWYRRRDTADPSIPNP